MGIDNRQRTFNELAILSHIMRTNSIDALQEIVGIPPLQLHNILTQAQADGKIKYNRKKSNFTLDADIDLPNLAVTDGMSQFIEEVELYVADANDRNSDITTDQLALAAGMRDDTLIRLAVFRSDKLASYDLSPKNDKKTVYTFVTLKDNLTHQWGKKQLEKGKK